MIAEQQERAKWLEERKTYIGASEIAAICGIHPYDTPRNVFLAKKGLVTIEDNLPMKVGRWLEDLCAREFEDLVRNELNLECELQQTGLHRHPTIQFLGCNPDRLWPFTPDGKAVVQLKTCSEYSSGDFGKPWSDEVKDEHLMQVVFEMGITRSPVGYLGVLIGNREFKAFKFTWTPEVHAIWRRAVEEAVFWWDTYYSKDVMPPVSGKDVDTDTIKRAYTEHDDQLVLADAYAESAIIGFPELQAEFDKLEEELNRRKNILREKIGNHVGLKSSLGIHTWKADKNGKRTLRHRWLS